MKRFMVAALLAALILSGCGIPDNSPVLPVAPGPSTGTSSGDAVTPTLPSREDATTPSRLVLDYLEAAAGNPVDAAARVKGFLSPATATAFKPQPNVVRVIHPVEDPLNNPGSNEVSFKAWQVGTLSDNGILSPSTDSGIAQYNFRVEEIEGQRGLFVAKAPAMLLLTDDALARYYELRTIYFWDTEHTVLVPDVRYMAKSTPLEQQPTEVLTWLTAGPSPWLEDAVEPLPEGTASIGNVPAVSNDKLQISLTAQAVPQDDKTGAVDRLRRQLMWSLKPNLPRILELKIGHQLVGDWEQTDFLSSNASYGLTENPERFVVYEGRIRRLSRSAYPADPVPVLPVEANRNILMAALSRSNDRSYAAVVVNDRGKAVLSVASARPGERATLRTVAVPGALGRPVWAVTPVEPEGGGIGLVPAGGRLYSFGAAGGAARPVVWPGAGRPAISVVAVAPDGHRVALVAGGRLYLSVLVAGGDGLQLAPPMEVRTPMSKLTAVDWSSEGWLVVGGTGPGDRVAITDITLDGARISPRLDDLGTEQISYLTAYPANPVNLQQHSDSVAYAAGGGAYDALAEATKISFRDLVNPPASSPNGATPTAPLFLR
jgi:lipoprotein LpqB-like beta-propeller protein/sporulation and spore germination protein